MFTGSLAIRLADKGIRVNAVAPGPVWTPLIAASFSEEKMASFDYMTGQVLHPNGGRIVNG